MKPETEVVGTQPAVSCIVGSAARPCDSEKNPPLIPPYSKGGDGSCEFLPPPLEQGGKVAVGLRGCVILFSVLVRGCGDHEEGCHEKVHQTRGRGVRSSDGS